MQLNVELTDSAVQEQSNMSLSDQINVSVHGDEYYTLQKSVDMIIPYILRGGDTRAYGVRLIQRKVTL